MNTITQIRHVVVAMALVVAGSGQQGLADAPTPTVIPLVGNWQLNLDRTQYGPGVERRRRERMTCSAEAATVRCSIESVRADGREPTARFAASLDGVPAPVTGIPDIDQVQLRRPRLEYIDATFLFRGKPAFGYRAFQSNDGRTLMIVAVDPVTRAAATTIVVYDRR